MNIDNFGHVLPAQWTSRIEGNLIFLAFLQLIPQRRINGGGGGWKLSLMAHFELSITRVTLILTDSLVILKLWRIDETVCSLQSLLRGDSPIPEPGRAGHASGYCTAERAHRKEVSGPQDVNGHGRELRRFRSRKIAGALRRNRGVGMHKETARSLPVNALRMLGKKLQANLTKITS